jgi:hypothetical protein
MKLKMSAKDNQDRTDTSYWLNTLSVTGILAGITFAALLILIEAKDAFVPPEWFPFREFYFEILVSGMGIVSILFIISVVHQTFFATYGSAQSISKYSTIVDELFSVGFIGLMVMIPMLISSFSLVGTVVIAILELTLNVYLIKHMIVYLKKLR